MTEIVMWVGVVLLFTGCLLTLVAALGLLRFDDLLAKQHAATKPQVLGLILMTSGVALIIGSPAVAWTVILVIAFQLVTAPIAAHMVGRAGYRTGRVRSDRLVVDELGDDLDEKKTDAPIGPGTAQSKK